MIGSQLSHRRVFCASEDAQLRVQTHLLHNVEFLVQGLVQTSVAEYILQRFFALALCEDLLGIFLRDDAVLLSKNLLTLAIGLDLSKESLSFTLSLSLLGVNECLSSYLGSFEL